MVPDLKKTRRSDAAAVPAVADEKSVTLISKEPFQDEVWTPEDVRQFLKLDSVDQVKELTRKRSKRPIPAHKTGKVNRFWKSEVIQWFNELGSAEPVSHATRVKLSKAMRRRLDEKKAA